MCSLYLGENLISGSKPINLGVRNIGEIVASPLPLTDAGLHLLDGSLILGGGIYQGFVDYIADLYTANPSANYFTTEALWQTAVTTYGVCGKFVYTETQTIEYYSWGNMVCTASATPQNGDAVYMLLIPSEGDPYAGEQLGTVVSYDGINDEITFSIEGSSFTQSRTSVADVITTTKTVRLPKITGIIEGTTDVSALGDLVEAGLPNITGTAIFQANISDASGALYVSRTDLTSENAGGGNYGDEFAINASRSSSIYGNSQTVQPQTIKVLYYIVIANSTKTDIQVNIDEIATDLNGKADTDLTNITNTGKIAIAHNAMPSNTYTALTLGASGTSYTAPADGWYGFAGITTGTSGTGYYTFSNTTKDYSYRTQQPANGYYISLPMFPVSKGDICSLTYHQLSVNSFFRFYYAQGSESEAS